MYTLVLYFSSAVTSRQHHRYSYIERREMGIAAQTSPISAS